MFEEYVCNYHADEILNILRQEDKKQHYSITINFLTLFEKNPKLGEEILSDSINVLERCDNELISAQRKLKKTISDENVKLRTKKRVHTRITALPLCPELHRTIFPRNEDIGSFLRVNGTVVRTVLPKLLEYKKIYYCTKCKQAFDVKIDYEQFNKLIVPDRCPNPEDCPGTTFKPVKDEEYIKDYQEIKIQEQIGKVGLGAMPRSMWVSLEDDLVDNCKPGDDVIICGTVIRRWHPLVANSFIDIELCLRANHLIVCNDQQSAIMITDEWCQEFENYWEDNKNNPFAARDHIIASISPQTYGLYTAKLAVALGLAGGVRRTAPEGGGIRIRGETHILFVGDPGTGKSQLLKFAWKVCPRSIFTTGVGSSRAGLTVSAFREGSEWHLEAGALVLADGGICCVDEFGSLKEDDRTAIHEAMEQQSISVAKAGLVCKLDTRCTVMAAMNPKTRYNLNLSLSENIKVASPLLSRFDLILILIDTNNEEWERIVSSYVLQGKKPIGKKNTPTSLWNLEKLQHYFCTIRNITPETTEEANLVLSKYYWMQRQSCQRNAARTTVRFLESLLRLSQAHAKLMFRNRVLVEDAVVAVSLMECSNDDGLSNNINTLYTNFPTCPKEDYLKKMEEILTKLGLEEIFETEMNRWYENSLQNESDKCINSSDASSQLSNKTESNLTNKITETIKNIKKKKENDFFVPQISNRDKVQQKTVSSKISPNEIDEFNDDSNDADIFVRCSKVKNNVVLKTTLNHVNNELSSHPKNNNSQSVRTSPKICVINSSVENDLNENQVNASKTSLSNNTLTDDLSLELEKDYNTTSNLFTDQTPSKSTLYSAQKAKLKLSKFKFSKKINPSEKQEMSTPTPDIPINNNDCTTTVITPTAPKIVPINLAKVFSAEDEEDLSYLDLE
ncbi:DNA helicase MCM9-like [Adelges cooleyi]|uniref:DNA helicase MCM9-like n=1 Tax=Adelges cooleyi TaxID=133065 RepID=UPI0021803492|nr:DNA helicase MCM9-like [Adelges cooleyi]